MFFKSNPQTHLPLPFFFSTVQAGFPSPADDYIENNLDLNEALIAHPSATFFVRVDGHSMENALIRNGDILIVDRAIRPSDGKIVLAILDGEFTVKRISIKNNQITLLSENPRFAPIPIKEGMDFQIWGTVTYIIHKAK